MFEDEIGFWIGCANAILIIVKQVADGIVRRAAKTMTQVHSITIDMVVLNPIT